ncbi:ribbon-helix-helix domain-containing protein [Nostoc sp. JL23]|uniref:ribbon-helix-helix domain-containing protein n=1 Tax=Nostoc sp. JL23 TaxID=2815394 RepID=UPI001DAA270E|nr:ribbon-helix-helix domain-containing protein [Nostoc sp. JL23]MBN3875269.1 ribbon-helix-helix domain-containing protein [Nostoc sp. JL23]
MSKISPTSLRLPNEIDQKLRLESERTGIPLTGLILFAVQEWLKYEKLTYSLRMPSGQFIEITATREATDNKKTA